jgi:hypothetical protein
MRADPARPARDLVGAAAELAPGSKVTPIEIGEALILP